MLAEITVGREEQRRAVQRPPVALNHADHQVQRVLGGDPCQAIDRRARHIDRGIKIAPELFPSLGGSVTDDGSERDPTRIPGRNASGNTTNAAPPALASPANRATLCNPRSRSKPAAAACIDRCLK